MEIPRYNPLIVYVDMTDYQDNHNPVQWLKKSITGFLDWFITRYNDIDSILIVPYLDGRFSSPASNKDIHKLVSIIRWAVENDPIYSHRENKLENKIFKYSGALEKTINFDTNNLRVFAKLLSPHIILTGTRIIPWTVENTDLISSVADVIIFSGRGNPYSGSDRKEWLDANRYRFK